MIDYKIAAIVVTYNRKELLKKCIESVLKQTYMPSCVYVIDNASTDGTNLLFETKQISSPLINYIQLKENGGGAQGFYEGIKRAHETNAFDGYWVMDDDGMPDTQCLENMLPYLFSYNYVSPLVVSIEDNKLLAFPYKGIMTCEELFVKYHFIVENYSCPFNGILYSRKLVDSIGYPLKELFIWGDEVNYHNRAINANYKPVTVLNAKHYHPKWKDVFVKSIGGREIVFVPQKWKGYCHYRNTIYNNKGKWSILKLISYYIKHIYYYLFIIKDFSWFLCFNDAYFSGLMERLNGHKKYLNKN